MIKRMTLFVLYLGIMLISGDITFAWNWDSPVMAGLGSFVMPGVGQAMNGDYSWGAVHFTARMAVASQYASCTERDDFIEFEDALDDDHNRQYTNTTTQTADVYERGLLFMHFYSSFAAYRDARQSDNSGYNTPAPTEDLGELALSPFRPDLLTRPGTFIPLILIAIYSANSDDIYTIQRDPDISEDEVMQARLLSSGFMDGISEECFFRGFLNNEFSDEFGSPLGLLFSSSIFGLLHFGAGNQATGLQAGLLGAYMGWLQQENGFKIDQSVAVHFWINAIGAYYEIKRGKEAQLISVRFPF